MNTESSSGAGLGPAEFIIIGLVVLLVAGLLITRLARRGTRDDELKLPRRSPGPTTDNQRDETTG